MATTRRTFLKLTGAFLTLAILPLRVIAEFIRPEAAFSATTADEAFSALGESIETSEKINLQTPDIAENGAVVPVEIRSNIPNTERISILIEKNPNPLSSVFTIPQGTEAFVQTRVKVAQTCLIYAVVEADGKLYKTAKETKVTLGGCGG